MQTRAKSSKTASDEKLSAGSIPTGTVQVTMKCNTETYSGTTEYKGKIIPEQYGELTKLLGDYFDKLEK